MSVLVRDWIVERIDYDYSEIMGVYLKTHLGEVLKSLSNGENYTIHDLEMNVKKPEIPAGEKSKRNFDVEVEGVLFSQDVVDELFGMNVKAVVGEFNCSKITILDTLQVAVNKLSKQELLAIRTKIQNGEL